MFRSARNQRRWIATFAVFAALLSQLVAAQQSEALDAPQVTLSVPATTTTGSTVTLVASAPTADANTTSETLIQQIDPTKFKLSNPSQITAPQGWTVSYSADGVNFTTAVPSTAAQWANVRAVKASGSIKSIGATSDGDQITASNSTVTPPPPVVFPAGGSGGDGWDVAFDDANHVYNVFHHNGQDGSTKGAVDCHTRSGASCGAAWPFNVSTNSATSGLKTAASSAAYVDNKNRHLWFVSGSSSTGTGFGCVDIANVAAPKFCGGSATTAFVKITNTPWTGIASNLVAARGKLFAIDDAAGIIMCLDPSANSGHGAACTDPTTQLPVTFSVPGAPKLIAFDSYGVSGWISYAQLASYGERLYVGETKYTQTAMCFDPVTMARCDGWAVPRPLSQSAAGLNYMVTIYRQPTAQGAFGAICFKFWAKQNCFNPDGTTATPNSGLAGFFDHFSLSPSLTYAFSHQRPSTVLDTKVIWAFPYGATPGASASPFCWDVAKNSWCDGWSGTTKTGGGQVYTVTQDPDVDTCFWTNGDSGIIAQWDISGSSACVTPPSKVSFKSDVFPPRMSCTPGSGVKAWGSFTLTSPLIGTYTNNGATVLAPTAQAKTAKLTVLDEAGVPIPNWIDIPIPASQGVPMPSPAVQQSIDLSTLPVSRTGQHPNFEVSFTGRAATPRSAAVEVTAIGDQPEMCINPTVAYPCPVGIGPVTSLPDIPAETLGSGSVGLSDASTVAMAGASATTTILAPSVSTCTASVGGRALDTLGNPISGVVVSLKDASGNPIVWPPGTLDAGKAVTTLTDANGNYTFANLLPNGYEVSFPDVSPAVQVTTSTVVSGAAGTVTGTATATSGVSLSKKVVITAGVNGVVNSLYVLMPTAEPDTSVGPVNTAQSILVLANDAAGGGATIVSSSVKLCAPGETSCARSTLSVAGEGTYTVQPNGTVTFVPVTGFVGEATPVTYSFLDSFSKSASSTLTPTVVAAPVAANDVSRGLPGQVQSASVLANDTPGSTTYPLLPQTVKLCATGESPNACTATLVIIPGEGTYSVNASTGAITFAPEANFIGSGSLTYQVTDGLGQTTSAVYTPQVLDAHVSSDSNVTPFDTVVSGSAATNDLMPSGTTYTLASSPAHGTVTMGSDGTYTYTPAPGFSGVDAFTYTACTADVPPACGTATVSIVVGPDAVDDADATERGIPVTSSLAANDTVPIGSTYRGTSTPEHGTVVVNADGTYTYTPDPSFTGVDSFTYEVCTPTEPKMCSTATVSVVVGPKAVDDATTTQFDVPVSGNLLSNDDYPMGSTAAVLSKPTHGVVALGADGSYTYTPAPGFSGIDSFTYQLCTADVPALCSEATMTVFVGPDASDDAKVVPMNTTVTQNAARNDAYPSGSTFSSTSSPAHGSVTMNADGTYSYTPNTGFSGTDSFTYEVCTPGTPELCAAATVTLIVVPDADDDFGATPSNTAFLGNAAANDAYPVGGTFTATSAPGHGSVVMNADGTYTYTPATGFTGTDTFTYEVCKDGQCASATVTIIVGPDAVDDAAATPLNTAVTASSAANDKLPSGSTFSVVGNPLNGHVTMTSSGTYTYTPNTGYTGADQFTYQACSAGVCSTATVYLTVGGAAGDDANVTPMGMAVNGDVSTNDGTAAGSTFTKATNPAHGSVTMAANGTYTYTPDPNFTGIDTFTYTVCTPAPNSTCSTQTVSVTVTPKAIDDVSTTPINTPITASWKANDGLPSTAVASVADTPSNGSVRLNSDGTYTYTPDDGFVGTDSFTYKTCTQDNPPFCSVATVSIVVGSKANDDTAATPFGTLVSADVSLNDSYPAGATFTRNSAPAHGTVTLNSNGTYSYQPAAGFTGADSFEYSVCSAGVCANATARIVVGPLATDDATSTPMNTPVTANAAANDVYPPGSVFQKTSNPSHGTVIMQPDGMYTYTPNSGFVGVDDFTYEVCDGNGMCSSTTVHIVVTPSAANDADITAMDTPMTASVVGNDLVPPGSSFVKTSDPSHGTVTMNTDGTYTYTPNAGFTGLDAFTYQACAPGTPQVCAPATVTILVGPNVVDDAESTPLDTKYFGSVAGNDSFPAGSTYRVAIGAQHGTVTMNALGRYEYTPAPGFVGRDTFTYQVCAPTSPKLCSTATVTITVAPEIAAVQTPIARDDTNSTPMNTKVKGNAAKNDTYPAGSVFTTISKPKHGSVKMKPNGKYVYTPKKGFNGVDHFRYQVCSPDTPPVCATAKVTITVGPQPLPLEVKAKPAKAKLPKRGTATVVASAQTSKQGIVRTTVQCVALTRGDMRYCTWKVKKNGAVVVHTLGYPNVRVSVTQRAYPKQGVSKKPSWTFHRSWRVTG